MVGGGGAGGPGRFGERKVGGAAAVGCPRAGSTGSLRVARVGAQTHPPCPTSPRVSARDVAGVEGGRRGVSGAGGGPGSGGGRSFFVSGSAAFSPWQSGQGTRGDLCAGGGDPRARRRAGALHGLAGRGVSPAHTDTHTRLPPTREDPRAGRSGSAGTGRGGARGAAPGPAPAAPEPGPGCSANPTASPVAPGPRAFSAADRDLSGKSAPPPRGLRGPGARPRPRLACLQISPEVGRDPQERALGMRDADTRAAPRGRPQAPPGPSPFCATKSHPPAVGRWGGAKGSEGRGEALRGPGQRAGGVSGRAGGPFLRGASAEPGALRGSRAACAPPLSRWIFFSFCRRELRAPVLTVPWKGTCQIPAQDAKARRPQTWGRRHFLLPPPPTPAPPICAAPRFPSVNPTAPPEPCSASFSSPSSVSPSAPKTFTNTPPPTRRRGNTPLSVAVQLEDGGSERKRG